MNFYEEIKEESSCGMKNRVGYLSINVPEEIIIAAGKMPFRITGSGEPVKKGNAYLPKTFDPYVLDCIEGALQGEYDELDGVVIANVSDAHRRLYDVWKTAVSSIEMFFLDLPKDSSGLRLKSFKFAVQSLIRAFEKAFNVKITGEKLNEAIVLCNVTRKLLLELNELRKRDNPVCSGEQFFNIVKWCQRNDKHMVNEKLAEFSGSLKSVGQDNESARKINKSRIMITGSVIGSSDIISLVENLDVNVVCEDLCVGSQYFSCPVDENSADPVDAIVQRYISIPTARMVDTEARWGNLLKMAKDFRVDGVIYFALKFDDIYLFEYPYIREKFQKAGYPLLFVEAENFLTTSGQIETRVGAFVEMLGEGDLC